MTRHVLLALTIALAGSPAPLARDRHNAAYVGGTFASFVTADERIEGCVDISQTSHLVFRAREDERSDRQLRIAYAGVHDLQFSRKSSRRFVATAAATAVLGPLGLVALTSKRHTPYLTVTYTDQGGAAQVAIFELGDAVVRQTVATLQLRSRVTVEYEDEGARRWLATRTPLDGESCHAGS